MTAIGLLFAIGILFLAVEIFVPGMVIGFLGIAALALGTVIAFISFGQTTGLMVALIAALLVGLTLWLEFWVFPRTRWARQLSISEPTPPPPQDVADRAVVIGRECIAVTLMAPGGLVELDGRQYDALCRSGHAAKGDRLKVTDANSFQLIVTQSTTKL